MTMGRRSGHGGHRVRGLVAQLTARLVIEEGYPVEVARRKAGKRCGARGGDDWPDELEIGQAMRAHLSLFHGEDELPWLQGLRAEACRWMRELTDFGPRLHGPVLEGVCGQRGPICLRLFVDDATRVARWLLQHPVPHELHDERVMRGGKSVSLPVYRFSLAGADMVWQVESDTGPQAFPAGSHIGLAQLMAVQADGRSLAL